VRLGVETLFIEPGSRWENGYIELFNSKLSDELLNREIFYTLTEVKILIEQWRKDPSKFEHTLYFNIGHQHPRLKYFMAPNTHCGMVNNQPPTRSAQRCLHDRGIYFDL